MMLIILMSIIKFIFKNYYHVYQSTKACFFQVSVSMAPIRYKLLKTKNKLYGVNETKENEKRSKDVPDPYKFDED